MTGLLLGATAIAITFFILGVVLHMIIATAAMSRLIDRRQREVRYWQDEVQRLRAARSGRDTALR